MDNPSIRTIRKQYELHPVLDLECSNLWYNDKDSLLLFKDYFLLTINDADISNHLETPVSLKMVVFKNSIIIFASDELYCIKQVFKNDLKFSQFPSKMNKNVPEEDIIRFSTRIKIEIGEEQGCTKTESIFHKILEAIYYRLEDTIINISTDAEQCLLNSKNHGVDKRIEFITGLVMSMETLIYLEEVISPKSRLFGNLLSCSFFSEYLKYYLRSLESRTAVLVEQIKNNKVLVKTAGRTYSDSIDSILVENSKNLNNTTKYFSSISTLFLPINLVAGLWGMNCRVPFDTVTGIAPFLVIITTSLVVFITCTIFFKKKGWM